MLRPAPGEWMPANMIINGSSYKKVTTKLNMKRTKSGMMTMFTTFLSLVFSDFTVFMISLRSRSRPKATMTMANSISPHANGTRDAASILSHLPFR